MSKIPLVLLQYYNSPQSKYYIQPKIVSWIRGKSARPR